MYAYAKFINIIGTIENSMIKNFSLKEDHTNRYYDEITYNISLNAMAYVSTT